MKRKTVHGLGDEGINLDLPAWNLPPGTFTGGGNVRFSDGMVGSIGGHIKYADMENDIPLWLMPAQSGELYYWLVAGLVSVQAWNGTSFTDITRTEGPYTGAERNRWSGGDLGEMPVMCNGVDSPQYWPGINLSVQLKDLPYDAGVGSTWSTEGYRCGVIRAFRGMLVAMDISDNDGDHKDMVHWSTPAQPGLPPDNWNYGDPESVSRRILMKGTGGFIVDGLQLRDSFIIYKNDSVWEMSFIGGNNVFRSRMITAEYGLLAVRAVVDIGGQHVCLGDNEVFMHNGQTFSSIIDNKIRSRLFGSIDADNYWQSYLVKNLLFNEVWVCYPTAGSEWCNMAAIWNYKDNTWTFRELPRTSFIERGVIVTDTSTPEQWDSLPDEQWRNWHGPWGEREYSPIEDYLVGTRPAYTGGVGTEQLITDNGMDDPLYWTTVGDAEIAGSQGVLNLLSGSVSASQITKETMFLTGLTYTVTFDVTFFDPLIEFGGVTVLNGTQLITAPVAAGVGFTQTFVADQDGSLIFSGDGYNNDAGDVYRQIRIDNISVVGPSPTTGDAKLFIFDKSFQFDGQNFTSFVERVALPIDDDINFDTVLSVYPHCTGNANLKISVGSMRDVNDAPTWKAPSDFDIETQRKIDCRVTGALFSIRFESSENTYWRLSGHTFQYVFAGER